jgi:capsular exopolysaccharide synthesis family protein
LADDVTLCSPSRTWLESLDARLSHKVVGAAHMSPASREQYRRLAATLHNGRVSRGAKVIMVASAVGGEGKTLTAANLALTFSESYHRRVLLVDADLRRPTIQQLFLHNRTAPSDHVAPHDQRPLPVSQVTPRLGILTIGSPSSAPMAELTSERMERLLQEAREAFDWIVIDTPPVALLADASLLASRVDGVILVVKAESTSLELVQQAVEAIGREKTLGFVLNAARMQPSAQYQYDESQQLTPSAEPPDSP